MRRVFSRIHHSPDEGMLLGESSQLSCSKSAIEDAQAHELRFLGDDHDDSISQQLLELSTRCLRPAKVRSVLRLAWTAEAGIRS